MYIPVKLIPNMMGAVDTVHSFLVNIIEFITQIAQYLLMARACIGVESDDSATFIALPG